MEYIIYDIMKLNTDIYYFWKIICQTDQLKSY